MSIRTTSRTISFSRPFVLTGIADEQPPGSYTVEIDEELLSHVSFPAYRRIATLMRLPPRPSSTERARVVHLDPLELAALLVADARAEDKTAATASDAATEPQATMVHAAEPFTPRGWKSRWHSWLVVWERIQKMSISYFRHRAAQSYRDARSSVAPHLDYESLMRLGRKFKARATTARARLARLRHAALQQEEAERRDLYSDSRE
jgi:hypothetical protein